MIAHVRGNLILKSLDSVVVDVNGVGYEIFVPLSTFYKLPEINSAVALSVHTHHKEDAIHLYGFLTRDEKEAFQLLISVTGVGPRLARNILSGIAVDELVSSIASGDKARLSSIPGIGGKTAERLILELRDKVKNIVKPVEGAQPVDLSAADVISALDNLGYKSAQSSEAVKKAKAALGENCGFEDLFKEALKILSKK